ncbi:cytochrome P450 9e2 [Trichonephila inaurata madagascariensis]|uniref:Cytochrome P450 9e2 n=1 Tax=Trichonephila inaurata madagascariensis TaxID=2747483 RepID=A0A8X7CHX8_9ARAC|nr:cytochrome P450 9e2 [Trichonephila inaurata madagascariensis]
MARNTFAARRGYKFVIFLMFPFLPSQIKKLFFNTGSANFFKDTTLQIIEHRKRTGQVRNDFLQLLLDTANEVSEEEKWEENEKGDIASNYAEQNEGQQMFRTTTNKKLSMNELVAQCVIFFLAGYETTASTLSYATYLLALYPKVQEKLREEVDNTLKENDGKLTYEVIQNMKYLDNVISETLRIFPPAVRLERTADADYKLAEKGLTIEKGMTISIPVYCLHRDPKYYPAPEKFEPDRFTAEDVRSEIPIHIYLSELDPGTALE